MLKAVLFDLDGTLLPLDMDVFINSYFSKLAAKIAPLGYNPKELIAGIWDATNAMFKNDGKLSNEEVFFNRAAEIFGKKILDDKFAFDEFYKNEFQSVANDCGFNPQSAQTVYKLKEKNLRVILATSPLFPSVAVESRIGWAGLKPEDFEIYTTYENSHYTKPNPKYYLEVLEKIGLEPQECLMVGNDVTEDMVAKEVGINVFLLTDCLINKKNEDISVYPNGNFDDLMLHIEKMLNNEV